MPKLPTLPQGFVNNVDLPLSAGLINQIIRAAIALDGWSYRRLNCTDSLAGRDTIAWNKGHTSGSKRLWYGAIQRLAGMTTLTCEGWANNVPGGVTIGIYLNGSPTPVTTITPSSSWSGTASLSSYAVGEIVTVDLRTTSGDLSASEYIVRDVYGSPLTQTLSWPSMPTFGGTYDSSRLNALINACSYLYERINAVPIIPTIGHFWSYGTSKVETAPIWSGSVARAYSDDILRIHGKVDVFNDSEYLQVLIDGVDVYNNSASPWTKGQHAEFYLPISLSSVSVGSRADVVINTVVTDDGRVPGLQAYNSRYSLYVLRAEAHSGGYPVSSPPALLAADTTMTAATLDSRLNALSAMLSDIKSRIDANSFIWNRARAFRRRYGDVNQMDNGKLRQEYTPIAQRFGDRLVVRGKDVGIGFGARIVEEMEDDWKQYRYKYDKTQSIISGDKIDTQIFQLDQVAGLYPGQFYALTGDVDYAAAFLS